MDVGVGVGYEMGVLREVEVVFQDGDNALGYAGITGNNGRLEVFVLSASTEL